MGLNDAAEMLEAAKAEALRLEREAARLGARVGVLEAQRQNLRRLLDRWDDRCVRVREGHLSRTAGDAIEECFRDLLRVLEVGPPAPEIAREDALVAARREGWLPCE